MNPFSGREVETPPINRRAFDCGQEGTHGEARWSRLPRSVVHGTEIRPSAENPAIGPDVPEPAPAANTNTYGHCAGLPRRTIVSLSFAFCVSHAGEECDKRVRARLKFCSSFIRGRR